MSNNERLVLVDAYNLVYRAFYALPGDLMTADGLHTNAIFGFATMFRKLFAGKTPAYGAVVFDAPGKTFRDERFAEYKAERPPMPSDLKEQLPKIRELVTAHGFPILQVPGVEADDVIGTLARMGREAGHEVQIISTDKDFAQLIDERVRMIDTLRDVTYDPELVRKKWGVRPDQIVDYLALLGDKVDNVPGVPGIGKKGAVDILAAHGTLKAALDNVESLKGRAKKALVEHRDLALLCQELVTIDQHLDLGVTFEDLRVTEPGTAGLNELYIGLQFYSLISAEDQDALSRGTGELDYQTITEASALTSFVASTDAKELVVVPIFADIPPAISPLIGIALSDVVGRARYVPLNADDALAEAAWKLLGDPQAPKIAHDHKALLRAGLRAGKPVDGFVFDTQLASFLINPTKLIPHRIDQLSKEYLHRTVRPAKSVIGSGKKQKRFADADASELADWACHLADAICEIAPLLRPLLASEGQSAHLEGHELPLAKILAQMEVDGILVDGDDLRALGVEFRARLDGYEARIHELAGRDFNINSTKQLGEVLFDEMGLPVIKRTKSGYSTNAEVLTKLADKGHEIATVLLDQRKLNKLINTYTDVLQKAVQPDTGRIHATFQQTTGATGRLISTDPDLQRTPIHTPEGKRIREAFIAPPGSKLISADWSQIELRILAHMSRDPDLVEAFTEGLDIHRRTASQLFDVGLEEVTHEQRGVGKTINFATIYGQGATALAQILGIPRKQAKSYIEGYFKAYAGVRTWLDATIASAKESGYVETMLGRRRYLPELSSNAFMERAAGERIAANTPIQGSAADLCKLVMLAIPQRLSEAGLSTRMLLQIHDELVFEAPESEVEAASAIIRDAMESAVDLAVPLVVDLGVGRSWAEAH